VRLAYQGEPGAYSERRHCIRAHSDTLPCKTLTRSSSGAAQEGHARRRADGKLHRRHDPPQLRPAVDHEIPITGEIEIDVVHCLQALPGTKLGTSRSSTRHPQALAQCERFLKAWA